MKTKFIVLSVILSLFVGSAVAYGAPKVREIMSYDFIAVIQTDDSKNVKVYKVDDGQNTCYVAYTAGWTNGNNTNISCVNNPVVNAVKK